MPKERTLLFSVKLKDCRVDTMRPSGHGGQGMQKRDSAVRIVHEPSGAVGNSSESREQLKNKKIAFSRMCKTPKFMAWVKLKAGFLDSALMESMAPKNIKVEYLGEDGT